MTGYRHKLRHNTKAGRTQTYAWLGSVLEALGGREGGLLDAMTQGMDVGKLCKALASVYASLIEVENGKQD